MDWFIRIADGKHFANSADEHVWATSSATPIGKCFIREARPGDRLWFVPNKSGSGGHIGRIAAVATLDRIAKREIGPLIALTRTDEERGWTETNGSWDTDIYQRDLIDVSSCNIMSGIVGQSPIHKYSQAKHTVDLALEFQNIQKQRRMREGCPRFGK